MLCGLVTKKQKDFLDITLQFFVQILTTYAVATDPASRNYGAKDGALLAIGNMAELLRKKSEYRGNLEDLLSSHVMMEFQNPLGFLRARACWIYGKLSNITFSNPGNLMG
eukprot:SAG31_NODE_16119_length_722_cov_0.958266_2_plen_109_part_01